MAREVSSVVWDWRRSGAGSLKSDGPASALRQAAILQTVVMAAVGLILYFLLGHHLVAQIVWGLAVVFLLLGLLHPPAYRPVHRFGQWLGHAVGTLLLYVLLVPCYYILFLPVSVILRLQKRDPMHRHYRSVELTYWIPRRLAPPPGIYERQFMREDGNARVLRRPVGCLPDVLEDGVPETAADSMPGAAERGSR